MIKLKSRPVLWTLAHISDLREILYSGVSALGNRHRSDILYEVRSLRKQHLVAADQERA